MTYSTKKNPEHNHGHSASKPSDIPARGWKEVGKRVINQMKKDHLQIVAAGVAFYFFLAVFPMIAAAISVYGLIISPAEVEQQMSSLMTIFPKDAYQMIREMLHNIASQPQDTLGWSLVISILLSLWSANKGTSAVFEGINIAYDEGDDRSFIKKTTITLLFTFGGIIVGFVSLMIVAGFPSFSESLGLSDTLTSVIQWLRWPVLLIIIYFMLSYTYKIAPDRDNPEFKWVSWGAAIATGLWLLGSLLFSLYVDNFGNFGEMYASFAAVIILMLWFFLTAYIILLGAEINSEMEHQTKADTTVGKDKPMGQRGAYHADHVASENH
jgi:membrane protein